MTDTPEEPHTPEALKTATEILDDIMRPRPGDPPPKPSPEVSRINRKVHLANAQTTRPREGEIAPPLAASLPDPRTGRSERY